MLWFALCCVSPALTGVMFGLCFVYSAHLRAIQRQCMSEQLSPVPQAGSSGCSSAHCYRAPRASWGICSLRLPPDKWGVCFSLAERCLSGGQRGWLPGGKWVLLMRLKTQFLKGQVVLNVLAHYPQIIYTLGYCLPFPKAAGKYVNGFSFI